VRDGAPPRHGPGPSRFCLTIPREIKARPCPDAPGARTGLAPADCGKLRIPDEEDETCT